MSKDLMSNIKQETLNILESLSFSEDKKILFANLVTKKYLFASRARWIYPFTYVVLGIAFIILFNFFHTVPIDAQWKFVGATVAVASALLAFWQPKVSITQVDCIKILEKPLTDVDMRAINSWLNVTSNNADKIFKLVGALGTYLAIYLTVLGG